MEQDERFIHDKASSVNPLVRYCHFGVSPVNYCDSGLFFLMLLLIGDVSWENLLFANVKTKVQISCTVTVQLISTFIFGT